MKKIGKVASIVILGGVFTSIAISQPVNENWSFSASSLTSESTSGRFGTDVDDFMDVNGWGNVQPEKLFAELTFNTTTLKVGAARNFGSIYIGTYLETTFGKWTSTSTSDSTSATWSNTSSPNLSYSVLAGIGDNLGIKFGIYMLNNDSSSKTTVGGTTNTTKTANSVVYPELSAGLNLELGDLFLTPHVNIGYYANADKNSTSSGTYTIITDKGWGAFILGLGTGLDFPENGIIQQSVSLDFTSRFYGVFNEDNYGKTYLRNEFILEPGYGVTITPADNVAVGLGVSGPLYFANEHTTGDSKTNKHIFSFIPQIDVGVQYVATEKFTLNLGGSIGFPSWYHVVSQSGSDTKTGTWYYGSNSTDSIGNNFSEELNLGFSYAFSEKVILDTNWNIFNNSVTTSLSNAWTTAISLQLLLKL